LRRMGAVNQLAKRGRHAWWKTSFGGGEGCVHMAEFGGGSCFMRSERRKGEGGGGALRRRSSRFLWVNGEGQGKEATFFWKGTHFHTTERAKAQQDIRPSAWAEDGVQGTK